MTRSRPTATHDPTLARARALADPTRLAVLRLVQGAAAPVGVQELAGRLSLHPNAVRQHVAQLRDAGLVIEEQGPRTGVGRPPLAYRPDPASAGHDGGWNPYEQLALLLLDVAAGRSPRQVGYEAGQRLAAHRATTDPIARLEAAMRHQGFAPRTTQTGAGTDIELGACPLAAAAGADRLVCELHRGLAEGLVEGLGATGARLTGLDVAPPDAGGCRLRVSTGPARAAATPDPLDPDGTHQGATP